MHTQHRTGGAVSNVITGYVINGCAGNVINGYVINADTAAWVGRVGNVINGYAGYDLHAMLSRD